MARRGVGGHLQKGKPVSNSLADILGICLIQSGLKGQLKKHSGFFFFFLNPDGPDGLQFIVKVQCL